MNEYYIIGTKYDDQDISTLLYEKQVISIGFAREVDLSDFYLKKSKSFDELGELLKNETPIAISQLKKFLSIKEGDLIALKGTGSPIGNQARLDIIGYAIVIKRNGVIYRHDPEGLWHNINVEFLEFGIKKTFPYGYGWSIYNISYIKERVEDIFGIYGKTNLNTLPINNINKSGVTQKNTDEREVNITASYIRSCIHNKIQQEIFNKFVEIFGKENVKMEENYVDISLIKDDTIFLIEVKPYNSARQCIREGIGQLLDYYQKHHNTKTDIILVIVGYGEPNNDDIEFINFIKNSFKIKFLYQDWQNLIQNPIASLFE